MNNLKSFFTLICLSGLLLSCSNKAQNEETNTVSNDVMTTTSATTENKTDDKSSSAEGKKEEGKYPVFQFEETEFDFGNIKEGEIVKHEFKFKNVGEVPLIITNATAQCGCTVPEPPKDPIAPGATNVIKVEFNSAGKAGLITKTISIEANTNPSLSTLQIKGQVQGVSQLKGPLRKP